MGFSRTFPPAWPFGIVAALLFSNTAAETPYYPWLADDFAIEKPLGNFRGDPIRGRALAMSRDKGNCIACHRMPIPEAPEHGTVGPPLFGVGGRLTEGQLRLRVVDEKVINPATIMPAFYRRPDRLNRPLPGRESTILTAREVEDIVAYLRTLQ